MRKALEDKISLSEAVRLAGRMIACYPNGGQQAGTSYIGALAAVLREYPRIIADRSPDPVHGVPKTSDFLPTPSVVIAWCERELNDLRRPLDAAENQERLAREAQARKDDENYWQKARKGRPTLKEMQEHYGPDWGITQPQRKRMPYTSLTDDDLRRLYPRAAQ